jgi:hypothetical protein
MTIDAFITLLIGTLVRTIPATADQTEGDRAANLSIVRTMIEAFHPADPTEAAEAARAVAAHFAAMDSFARAARPGVADEKAVRLRASALAAGRLFSTILQNHAASSANCPTQTDLPAPVAMRQCRRRRCVIVPNFRLISPGSPAPRPRRRRGRHGTAPQHLPLCCQPSSLPDRRSALRAMHGNATGTLS